MICFICLYEIEENAPGHEFIIDESGIQINYHEECRDLMSEIETDPGLITA